MVPLVDEVVSNIGHIGAAFHDRPDRVSLVTMKVNTAFMV